MAAMTFHAEQCRHLASKNKASVGWYAAVPASS